MVDGDLVRSCLLFAWQVDGHDVVTIEGVETPEGLSDVQEAFVSKHAMQCGYCTPGMIMTVEHLLQENPFPTHDDLVDAISGNLCRCTGYQQILEAAQSVVDAKRTRG
jgi:carbon-monoxide dehydrogenase small subunit